MNLRRHHSPAIAGAKAGFSTAAAYRFEKDPRLPSQKRAPRERRRADPFVDIWENEVLPLLEPTRADDVKPDECGHASVYSNPSEETASGEDTSAKELTAAHRSLPFETTVLVENRENGRSSVVRITDRGPHVSGRIIDVSQAAACTRLRGFDEGVPQDPVDPGRSTSR